MVRAHERLTPHGRWLLVERVRGQGRPTAHVVREPGVPRQRVQTVAWRSLAVGQVTGHERTAAFTTWLREDDTERHHSALGAAPITRL